MNETEVSIKVKVFSDPEYCSANCALRCGITLYCAWPGSTISKRITLKNGVEFKHDECKEALKQANDKIS